MKDTSELNQAHMPVLAKSLIELQLPLMLALLLTTPLASAEIGCRKANPDRLDCSSLSVSAQCSSAGAVFTIRNTGEPGEGDMQRSTEYRIYRNGALVTRGQVQLAGGAKKVISYAGTGNMRLEVDQQIGHPGKSRPNAKVLCEATETPTSTPTPMVTPSPNPTPNSTPRATPSATPTIQPTSTPTTTPTLTPPQTDPKCLTTDLLANPSRCKPDCLGTPGGTANFDACNVCDGDGTSCVTCQTQDISELLATLDGAARRQFRLLRRAVRAYAAARGKNARFKDSIEQAQHLYLENWTLAWTIPPSILTCSDSHTCNDVDNTDLLEHYRSNSASLLKLTLRIAGSIRASANRINSSHSRKLRTTATRIKRKARKMYRYNVALTNTVPATVTQCS